MRLASVVTAVICVWPIISKASGSYGSVHKQVTATVVICPDLAYEDVVYVAIDRADKVNDVASKTKSVDPAQSAYAHSTNP